VESVKAVSELYMPVGGEVLSVNKTLEDAPEILNKEPYGLGWLIEIKLEDPAELKSLMDRDAYLDFLKGLSR
ncbi:MAG: glycine cleavage system protein H, partial [Deltaproteobacteria bacterium]